MAQLANQWCSLLEAKTLFLKSFQDFYSLKPSKAYLQISGAILFFSKPKIKLNEILPCKILAS